MQGQTKAGVAITSVKVLVVWGIFGAILAKIVLEDGFGIATDVTTPGVQLGALLVALLSVGCYALILRWRRFASFNGEALGSGISPRDQQKFFHARATWIVWVAIAFFLAVGAIVGTAKMSASEIVTQKALGALASEAMFPPCKAAGITASAMAIKRDQGMTKEDMQNLYQPNDILDTKAWGVMVDMVYGHPELNPDAIERAFTSHC